VLVAGLEKPSFKSNLFRGKICDNFLEFEKGLFEKIDLDPSSEYESYFSPNNFKKNEIDNELKEIELKNAVFEPVIEDMFFTLD
jgi:hypothetical protein